MFITDKEFDEVVARDNPEKCMGLRHYIVNNGTPYAQIEAVFRRASREVLRLPLPCCRECEENMRRAEGSYCRECGKPIADGTRCQECQIKK